MRTYRKIGMRCMSLGEALIPNHTHRERDMEMLRMISRLPNSTIIFRPGWADRASKQNSRIRGRHRRGKGLLQ
jgi:hypothetical protein